MNSLAFFNPRFTSDLFDVIDRNFASMMPTTEKSGSLVPKVDVRETKDAYILDMDLPGVSEKDVAINLKDKVLSISSQKEEKTEEKKDGEWLIRERRSASFARHFTLPDDIDAENVSAEFQNGVLTVNIPRKAETKPKTIAITAK
ncbi:MAG TPA: Hsp20/alpha crystallin family protein [Candidatus Treponema faecavium]|nr:Hsp20/alpha crystallin family protein [Candidatus Treponema faecavium]